MIARRSRGFTLIEVIVASSVLVGVVALALGLFVDTNISVGESLSITGSAMNANRAQADLRLELRSASSLTLGATNAAGVFVLGATNVSPVGAHTSVQFSTWSTLDPATGTQTLGALREIRFVFTEASNNVDDDRDGFVDEGQLVVMADLDGNGSIAATEQLYVLADNISGDDFAFSFPDGTALEGANLSMSTVLTGLYRARTVGGSDGTTGETRTLILALRNKQ